MRWAESFLPTVLRTQPPSVVRERIAGLVCAVIAFWTEVCYIMGVAQRTPNLMLLIPAYNEEQRIEPVLREYAQFFRKQYTGKFQIVVVLNGCVDDTAGVVDRVAAVYPEIRALNFPAPIGKGGALKIGRAHV